MLKFYVSLISLIFSFNSYSQDVDYQLSGFATSTIYSNNQWLNNSNKVALNFDITRDKYALHGQIDNTVKNPIRRLTFEREVFFNTTHDFIFKVGRFTRINSFYNNITDNPTDSLLAMVPIAEYNSRVLSNSTFSTLDGILLTLKYSEPAHSLNFNFGIGNPSIEKRCETSIEVYRRPCTEGYSFKSDGRNYTVQSTYERGNWGILISKSKLLIETVLEDTNDINAIILTNNINEITVFSDRLNFKYSNNEYWLQTGLVLTSVYYNKLGFNNVKTINTKGTYNVFGYKWTDSLSTHLVYSKGVDSNNGVNTDRAVGVTYFTDSIITSLEYHLNNGTEWTKLFNPNQTNKSFVLTTTYSF